jgi:hypothetical protein
VGIKDGPKIRGAYELLDDWYRERHIKRIQEKGIGRRKRARIRMMRWKPKSTQEKTKEFDEIGYLIGSKGDLQQEKTKRRIKEIDEEQEKLLERHIKINYWSKGIATPDKIEVLERDIDCLWEKVRVYEADAKEERTLRIKAVEELRKHEKKMFGDVRPFDKDIFREDARPNRWTNPKIKMRGPIEPERVNVKMMKIKPITAPSSGSSMLDVDEEDDPTREIKEVGYILGAQANQSETNFRQKMKKIDDQETILEKQYKEASQKAPKTGKLLLLLQCKRQTACHNVQ